MSEFFLFFSSFFDVAAASVLAVVALPLLLVVYLFGSVAVVAFIFLYSPCFGFCYWCCCRLHRRWRNEGGKLVELLLFVVVVAVGDPVVLIDPLVFLWLFF